MGKVAYSVFFLQDGAMVQTAHRLMFPSDDDAVAVVTIYTFSFIKT